MVIFMYIHNLIGCIKHIRNPVHYTAKFWMLYAKILVREKKQLAFSCNCSNCITRLGWSMAACLASDHKAVLGVTR